MSEPAPPRLGSISWADLTVPAAPAVRDFYRDVVGWEFSEVDMGGYVDFCMNLPGGGEPIAGICHARGANSNLPPQWLVYINVTDLDHSIARCLEGGGDVIAGPRSMGKQGRFCVIRDPAGAAVALVEAAP